MVNPMRSSLNLRVSWKPVNPQDCVWENLFRIIMKTILQEKGGCDGHAADAVSANTQVKMEDAPKLL